MLSVFQNKVVSVLRLSIVSGNRNAYQTVMSADCEIQNTDSLYARSVDKTASKNYLAWFDIDTDIREGDILRDQDTNRRFRVVAIEKQGGGLGLAVDHLEVTLERYTS